MKLLSRNPATEQIEVSFPTLSQNQIMHQLAKAERAFNSWSILQIQERLAKIARLAKLLRQNKQIYAEIITREMGKPITEAQAEIEKCAVCCEYYLANASAFLKPRQIKTEAKSSYVRYDPLGVVLAIMPWNFPFWQVIRCAIPALAAGNVILLKHASNVPRCAIALNKLFKSAAFPEGTFTNLQVTSEKLSPLVQHPAIAGISLTGSIEAGASIATLAGPHLKKCVFELGGSDPFIVLDDADLDAAAKNGVQARMLNAGQSCIAAKRFIVTKKSIAEFIPRFINNMKSLSVGDPLNPKTQVGPLAREDLREMLDVQVKKAIKQGAHCILGGFKIAGRGYFYAPTVLTNITPRMSIAKEEVFGPVACIYTVASEKEALALANSTNFGLGASLWSRNRKKAELLAAKIQSGIVGINTIVRSDPRLPFGGVKHSGLGRELSEEGIREFVNVKTVVVN